MLPKVSGGLPERFFDSFMGTVLLKGLGDRARVQGRGLPSGLAFLVRKRRVVRGRSWLSVFSYLKRVGHSGWFRGFSV